MTLTENLQAILERIRLAKHKSARPSRNVTLICVSKYHTIEESQALYDLGCRHFAENYVAGLLEKKAALPKDIAWHLIGPLQSRKVKDVINEINYYHALDRLKIAKEIEKRALHVIPCFIEVNISGESSKSGIRPEEVIDFVRALASYSKIKVIGLMTMAPHDSTIDEQSHIFEQLRSLSEAVQVLQLPYAPCLELSMGMSADYEVAIRQGATYVRIGSALFKE